MITAAVASRFHLFYAAMVREQKKAVTGVAKTRPFITDLLSVAKLIFHAWVAWWIISNLYICHTLNIKTTSDKTHTY